VKYRDKSDGKVRALGTAKLTGQIFARKIIRIMGSNQHQEIVRKTIENEVRAVTKICQSGHSNIVKVLRHRAIPDTMLYEIDMEYCVYNLHTYMTRHSPSSENPIEMRYLIAIMLSITNGLIFIHSKGEVHRDLKPANGAIPHRDG
jgi:serine/threonine protein kinase